VIADWFNGELAKLSEHKSTALGVSWTIAGANYDFTAIEVACGQQNRISLSRIAGDVSNKAANCFDSNSPYGRHYGLIY